MGFSRDPYWWKKFAQQQLIRASHGRVLVFERPKHGIIDTEDLERAPGKINVIVDVGANTGQSAIRFRAAFPSARIISLEPISATFEELRRRTAGLDVECHRLALGPTKSREIMYLTPYSLTNSLIRPKNEDIHGTEVVDVETFDNFIDEQKIDLVDLLKIDAEGFDLQVINGAKRAMSDGKIRFIMAEVGLNSAEDRHPLFDEVRGVLSSYGFRVFGLYSQTLEWSGKPSLRLANAIFCRQGVV